MQGKFTNISLNAPYVSPPSQRIQEINPQGKQYAVDRSEDSTRSSLTQRNHSPNTQRDQDKNSNPNEKSVQRKKYLEIGAGVKRTESWIPTPGDTHQPRQPAVRSPLLGVHEEQNPRDVERKACSLQPVTSSPSSIRLPMACQTLIPIRFS